MNAKTSLPEAAALRETISRQYNEVAGQLAQRLQSQTQGEVLFSQGDKARYATDASIYQVIPTGVFVPKVEADVALALEISRDLKVPITARGGGTSQCGQTVGAGLVLDTSKHLRKVLVLNVAERTVVVQPGIVLDHLNAQLKSTGLWYPVDVSTSAQATLGGMAGNNSCGSRSLAWGNMVHNVAGTRVRLADGSALNLEKFSNAQGSELQFGEFVRSLALHLEPEMKQHWPKVMRRVAGYNLDVFCNQSERPYTNDGSVNLAHLMVGSEGTLGITEQLTLHLSELPQAKVLGVVNFPTFAKAMDSAQHIVALGRALSENASGGGATLSAVELVDATMIELSLRNPAFAPTVRSALAPGINGGHPAALLLVEFCGRNKTELLPRLKDLQDLMGELGLPDSVVTMPDDAPQKNLWEVRKAGLNIMMSLKGDGKPVSFIEDCAVPLENLAEYTDALTEVFRRHGSKGTWYAHASVGTLHVRPILDMRRDGAAKMRAIAIEASELVRRFKGAYSGEHGDGLCRGEWIRWQFGDQITDAFAQIKNYLDPNNLLNPQRIIDPPAMDDQSLMRFSPSYKVIQLKPALDWQQWNVQNNPVTEETTAPGTGEDPAAGFAKAVEMCNNNGHCRKFDAGTMCPSYRVTRDEKDATRGRANTLRLALSGQLEGGLNHPDVAQAMDLCVGCKGCKRDCPTGVDMARMKIEFLHQTQATRHANYPQQKRLESLVARLPDYAAVASRFAPLLNLRNRWPWLAQLGESLFGISARRSLPLWRSDIFFAKVDSKNTSPLQNLVSLQQLLTATKPVALFADTFNGYFEPDNLVAAVKVLQAAGYSVHIANRESNGQALCCGRTLLASGQVDAARVKISKLLDALLPIAQKSIAIVGLEPSCLLTLRDEALAMAAEQSKLGVIAKTVANQAMLFEEFLGHELAQGRLDDLKTKLKPATQTMLLHGHCHQKAFGVMPSVSQVLALIPKAQVELIESSCCGMAGAFGYEAKHIDVSMQMAELALLPAIRNKPNALVVADGTSCRHQINDGAQREALHVALVLARHLSE
jgi:FAD/FMN-containing dehydrogenase/Fe-S oxidoreductase